MPHKKCIIPTDTGKGGIIYGFPTLEVYSLPKKNHSVTKLSNPLLRDVILAGSPDKV